MAEWGSSGVTEAEITRMEENGLVSEPSALTSKVEWMSMVMHPLGTLALPTLAIGSAPTVAPAAALA